MLYCSICSCGNWVCTSNPCQEIPYKVRASPKQTGKATINSEEEDTEEVFTYDDMDNVVQWFNNQPMNVL